MRSCSSGIQFLQELAAAGTIPTTQYIGPAAVDENDWTQDAVFSKFDIIVKPQDQAVLRCCLRKNDEGGRKGHRSAATSYGLGAIYFGRDKFTHLGLDRWQNNSLGLCREVNAISEQLLARSSVCCV